MLRGTLANEWHAADEAGKLQMLKNASTFECPLSTVMLDEAVEVLDGLARKADMAAIRYAHVDPAGQSYPAPAVVAKAYAHRYRPRVMKA